MKSHFLKMALCAAIIVVANYSTKAQTTETFESQVPYTNSFVSNGQPFSLTNVFSIYSSRNGIGYDQSHRFIDNFNSPALNQVNSIKTTDALVFSVKNLWVFLSSDGGNNPSTNGSLIIRGKHAGSVVFTVTKSSGFNTSFGINNGFSFINLVTEGGVDNSNQIIDEIEFQLQGNFNYIAIDNFTWQSNVVLPVSLINYKALLDKGNVLLNWSTSSENNSGYYIVERSNDGIHFNSIAKLKAAGSSNKNTEYNAIDNSPLNGVSYYRLKSLDLDGRSKIIGIEMIKNKSGNTAASVYPNPVIGNELTLRSVSSAGTQPYIIVNMAGKIMKTGIISNDRQPIGIQNFAPGNYFIKLSDGQVLKWIKQ